MSKKTQIALLIIILLFSVGLKYHFLDNFNIDRAGDELVYSTLAEKMSKNPLDYTTSDTYFTSWGDYYKRPLFSHPPMYPFLLSIVIKIYGRDFSKMAAINIVSHTVTLVFVFLLAEELYDEKVAILASGFFALDPVGLILANRLWIEETLSMWIILSFYFFIRGKKNENNYYLSGVFLGLAFLTKASAYPMVLVYLAMLGFKPKRIHIKAFLISILIFSPWILWNFKLGLNPFSFTYYNVDPRQLKVLSSPWYTPLLGLAAVNPLFLLSFIALGYNAIIGGSSDLELVTLTYIFIFCIAFKIKVLHYLGIIVPFLIILSSWYLLELEKNILKRITKIYSILFEKHLALFDLFLIIAWYNLKISQELSKIYFIQGLRLLTFGIFGGII